MFLHNLQAIVKTKKESTNNKGGRNRNNKKDNKSSKNKNSVSASNSTKSKVNNNPVANNNSNIGTVSSLSVEERPKRGWEKPEITKKMVKDVVEEIVVESVKESDVVSKSVKEDDKVLDNKKEPSSVKPTIAAVDDATVACSSSISTINNKKEISTTIPTAVPSSPVSRQFSWADESDDESESGIAEINVVDDKKIKEKSNQASASWANSKKSFADIIKTEGSLPPSSTGKTENTNLTTESSKKKDSSAAFGKKKNNAEQSNSTKVTNLEKNWRQPDKRKQDLDSK